MLGWCLTLDLPVSRSCSHGDGAGAGWLLLQRGLSRYKGVAIRGVQGWEGHCAFPRAWDPSQEGHTQLGRAWEPTAWTCDTFTYTAIQDLLIEHLLCARPCPESWDRVDTDNKQMVTSMLITVGGRGMRPGVIRGCCLGL